MEGKFSKAIRAVRNYFKFSDRAMLLLCLITSSFGVFIIYKCTTYFFESLSYTVVQLAAAVLGFLLAILISLIDYRALARLWKIHAPIAIFLVGLTFFFGLKNAGADDKAWLQIPFTSLTFQPSEILKLSFILTFALHLEAVKDRLNSLPQVILLCIHGAMPTLLIVMQGDDGSALVFLCIFLFMLFSADLSWKYILPPLCALPVIGYVMWQYIMTPDQKARIEVVFNPEAYPLTISVQPRQGRIALGSGMLFGKGFDANLRKVPAVQSDYIFAFIGETLGFLGCLAVIILLLSICFRAIYNSYKSDDYLGKFICIGVFAMLSSQTVINLGMVLSLLPVIGITLPLFSAGGTSVVVTYSAIGLVLSVAYHNRRRNRRTPY
ncbi:MAG: FtsW/RodA/SpoVE family cell cycle protein [Oscillospiraceae bacterium]|nr:FtsW/RodA/SpoVE family cell cycle protein [Oscillospiraceae bacterium]